jgi:poly(A) polymerase
VLDNLCRRSDNIWLRWSALLHDIAKPATKKFHPETGWTFHGHEWLGRQYGAAYFPQPAAAPGQQDGLCAKNGAPALAAHQPDQGTGNRQRRAAPAVRCRAGNRRPHEILCASDITTKNPNKMARYLEGYEYLKERMAEVTSADRLRLWQPPITGDIIMQTFGIPPSKEVGIIKTAVREAMLEGTIPNDLRSGFSTYAGGGG